MPTYPGVVELQNKGSRLYVRRRDVGSVRVLSDGSVELRAGGYLYFWEPWDIDAAAMLDQLFGAPLAEPTDPDTWDVVEQCGP